MKRGPKQSKPLDGYMRVKDICQKYDIALSTVYGWRNLDKMPEPCLVKGKNHYWKIEVVEALLREMEVI